MDAQSLFNLNGAVAVVTGGGTGIGLICARTLAANGAKVYITGRREQMLKDAVQAHGQGLRGSIVPVPTDITNKDDLVKLRDAIEEKKIHILVKCVARTRCCQVVGTFS